MPFVASSPHGYAGPTRIAKRKSAEQIRVERLVAKMERSIRRAFLAFVRNVTDKKVLTEIAEMLGRGEIAEALRIVDQYVARLGNVIADVFQDAARDENAAMARQIERISPIVGISFDPTNPEAARLMRNSRLEFIREFSASQRSAVRNALQQALLDGAGPRETARVFRDVIGLTANQDASVRNYRRLLTEGNREALARDLRDRRFDRTVQRASRTGEPLTRKQIDAMVDRYRQRFLMYRAEVIARTETSRVVGRARQEGLRQALVDADLPADVVERVWRSTPDHRRRFTHRAMEGQAVGMNEPFVSPSGARLMYPGDPSAPADETIQCRCIVINRIKKP